MVFIKQIKLSRPHISEILDTAMHISSWSFKVTVDCGAAHDPPVLPSIINSVDTALQNEFNLKTDWISTK